MAGSLGTISGQVKLDISQAIAAFAAMKRASAASSRDMTTASKGLGSLGKISLVAGGAIVAGFAMAVNAAADFDKKMSYVQGVTHSTGAEMEQVRAKALQLGRDGQFSAGQIADGFVEMAKAGISVQDMTHGMADAMTNLASAADVKLGTAVEDLIAQMHTYNISTKDAGHVADELAGTMHASVISLNDVSNSMKYAGGVARALGISFDSVSEAVAILGKAGIKGSSAGTQLRQIMVSLSGGSKKASAELKNLGIITKDGTNLFFDAHGKAKSLAEVFQILQDHTRGLTQQQQLMAFKTIFNNRALSAAEILTQAGAKGFAEMNKQISKTTAADVAAKRLDNLRGDLQKLKGSFDTLMIEVGEPFQKFLRGIVQGLTGMLNWFIKLPSGVRTTIVAIIGIIGVLLTFFGTLLMAGMVILKFRKAIEEMRLAFKIVDIAMKGVGSALRLMNSALLTSPIFWIVVAIIAVAIAFYELYKHCKTFRDAVNEVGRAIKTGFMAAVHWFEGLPKFFEGIWKDITHWFEQGVSWVKKNWDILLAIFTGPIGLIILVWRRFGDTILNFFKAIPGAIAHFASSAWSGIMSFFGKLPYYIGFVIGFVIGLFVRGLVTVATYLWKWSVDAYNAVVNFFEKLPGEIATFFTDLWNNFVSWSVNFYNSAVKWATDTYHGLVNWFQKLPGRIANFFVSLWHSAQRTWASFKSGAINFAVSSYNGIVNWFQKLPGRIVSFFTSLYHGAVNQLSSFASAAGNFASNAYHGFVNWVNRIPGAVNGAINDAISAFKSMIGAAWDAAKGFASGLWNGFKKGLGINSPSLIEKQMWQITKVTDTETRRLATHVRLMQDLHGRISKANPAHAMSTLNTSTMSSITNSMIKQAAILNAAGKAMYGGSGTVTAAAMASASGAYMPSATAQGSSLVTKNINVTVNNPVAERASDSTARKLRQLSDMGAL